jgi:hypothetical protein
MFFVVLSLIVSIHIGTISFKAASTIYKYTRDATTLNEELVTGTKKIRAIKKAPLFNEASKERTIDS